MYQPIYDLILTGGKNGTAWCCVARWQTCCRCHHSGHDWTSVLSGVILMSVVSCHYMSHSISQWYGPHRETNLNIITGPTWSADWGGWWPPYFLIIPPGLWVPNIAVRRQVRLCPLLICWSRFVHLIIISSHLSTPRHHQQDFQGENPHNCKLKVKQRRWEEGRGGEVWKVMTLMGQ